MLSDYRNSQNSILWKLRYDRSNRTELIQNSIKVTKHGQIKLVECLICRELPSVYDLRRDRDLVYSLEANYSKIVSKKNSMLVQLEAL